MTHADADADVDADYDTKNVPGDEEVQKKVENGKDKDSNPLAPPINTQGGS